MGKFGTMLQDKFDVASRVKHDTTEGSKGICYVVDIKSSEDDDYPKKRNIVVSYNME